MNESFEKNSSLYRGQSKGDLDEQSERGSMMSELGSVRTRKHSKRHKSKRHRKSEIDGEIKENYDEDKPLTKEEEQEE